MHSGIQHCSSSDMRGVKLMQYNVIDYLGKSAGKFSDKTAVSDIYGSFYIFTVA